MPPQSRAQETREEQQLLQSIARIHSYGQEYNFAQPFRQGEQHKGVGTGSFVAPPHPRPHKLYVLTCAHVVDSANRVAVLLPLVSQVEEIAASVVSFVPEYDLALLEVDDPEDKYRPHTHALQLGSSAQLKLRAKLAAFGFPLGLSALKVSEGVYAGYEHVLQHTASISPGNSGGPLVNAHNQIVGVNSSGIKEPTASDIFFAVPIEFYISQRDRMFGAGDMKVLHVPSFGFYYQEATRGQVEAATGGAACCQSGVYIYTVLPETPAAQGGIHEGAILCSFNDVQVENTGEVQVPWNYQKVQLSRLLSRSVDMNSRYPFTLFADGECKTVQLSPAVVVRHGLKTFYPPYDRVDYVAFMGLCIMPLCRNHSRIPELAPSYIGMEVDELYQPHLIITHIFSGSKAEVVNAVKVGDFVVKVNGAPVTTLEDVRRHFQEPVNKLLSVETRRGRVLALKVDDVLQEERENAAVTPPLYPVERAIVDALT